MKILIMFLCLALPVAASLIPLEWDAPDSPDTPDAYAVMIRGETDADFRWNQSIATLQADVVNLPPGKYSIYVAAVKGGVLGWPSNTIEVEVMGPVKNLHIRGLTLLRSTDMETWTAAAHIDIPDDDRAFYKIAFAQK